jgi:hypothetical protein
MLRHILGAQILTTMILPHRLRCYNLMIRPLNYPQNPLVLLPPRLRQSLRQRQLY